MSTRHLRSAAAWLPAIILPLATAEQLRVLYGADTVDGASALVWVMFLLANIGAMFLGKAETSLARLQMWLAFGLTSVFDLALVSLILARSHS